jgi:pimeloyl-ACP methyl ester carboxylesterase
MTVARGYSDTSFGQIHWRMAGRSGNRPDLYCLHPAPFSGLAFTAIMPHLQQGRRIFAPDYPGHGGSDPFRPDASVTDYACAMGELIAILSPDAPVDLTGFHTGCFVATELSLIALEKIRRLVLIDVPAFDAETRAQRLKTAGGQFEITPDLACLEAAWDLGMTKRIESQGLERSFDMFVEQLRHGRGRNAAFHAGFSYDVEARLPAVSHPVAVITSASPLTEATHRAASLIPGAKLIERPDIKRAVLDEAAAETAAEISAFLEHGA